MAWQKGQSGNPKGRAAEKPFRDALMMEIADAGENHKALRVVARKLLDGAMGGDLQAIKELVDRTDGKPAQAVIATGDDEGGPIRVTFEWLKPSA